MYVILVYDIRLDETGARVLRNVFKICKKYLTHIQNSTFEGELTPSSLKRVYNFWCWYLNVLTPFLLFFSKKR